MVTRYEARYVDDGFGRRRLSYMLAYDYGVSPRAGSSRELALRSNAANLQRSWYKYTGIPVKPGVKPPENAETSDTSWITSNFASLETLAYQRWRGKLAKGSASLGVTLASWQQSRDMIVKRSTQLTRALDSTIAMLSRDKRQRKALRLLVAKRKRQNRELLADDVLEYQFGWSPLFQDVHAALTTVCKPPPSIFIGGRASTHVSRRLTKGYDPTYFLTGDGRVSVSYATRVTVSNPNVALANRLGVINPVTVAWDLVPWSFVVNMFVNVNTFINSVTDEMGYDVTDRAITRSYLVSNETYARSSSGSSFQTGIHRGKQRVLGVKPQLTVQLRAPELSWGTAIMAASLVVQRFKKLNNLIGI